MLNIDELHELAARRRGYYGKRTWVEDDTDQTAAPQRRNPSLIQKK